MSTGGWPLVVSFGEALTDLVRSGAAQWQSHPGGSTWNLARALSKLGVPCAFAGGISSDVFGQQLLEASLAAGLDERFIQTWDKAPLLAVVHELAPPQYFFIGDDSADLCFDVQRLPSGWRQALRWAHFGGISLAREPLAQRLVALAAELKSEGKQISFDPNYRLLMDQCFDSTLQRMCELADVIKVSDEDLRGLFRSSDVEQGLARIRQWNPQAWLMLTSGADGARLYGAQGAARARPPQVEVVDTIGAGDASMAGLIDSLLQHPEGAADQHLRWAVAAGTAACTQPGSCSPGRETVSAIAARAECSRI
ncbi:carbohydrate kinase [Paucibacter sp. JuS9]|uniref:carbohydrate kinase family protein n=1 Tax=Paucibacter sp. JuS9 TaxID=3228748 RepID=UPI003756BFFF